MAAPTLETVDPLLVWIPAAWLAALFAHAALSKLLDSALFLQHLGAYRVPDRWLGLLQHGLPLAELAVTVLLLSPWRALGALGAAGLLAAYAGAMATHLRAGRRPDCGCGGEPLPLSWVLVGRNLGLMALALAASLTPADRTMTLADHAVTAAAVLLGSLLWAAFHQVLRQQRPTRFVEKH
ncbi:MauE/DoxX family redox-associated membrane protein [Ideonella sp.]|jgi:hypothetical protein|uniref:MauE/DoxX family redox-associated membrane protein n=1 Tax=Ideonella sp. TaxID=1929293 RepID=UPI0037BE7B4F